MLFKGGRVATPSTPLLDPPLFLALFSCSLTLINVLTENYTTSECSEIIMYVKCRTERAIGRTSYNLNRCLGNNWIYWNTKNRGTWFVNYLNNTASHVKFNFSLSAYSDHYKNFHTAYKPNLGYTPPLPSSKKKKGRRWSILIESLIFQ